LYDGGTREMKRVIYAIIWILTIIIALILGRYYPKYSVFFCGHGSDIIIGLMTGIIVSIGGALVSKVLSEKKELAIASQEYGRYCGKIHNLLNEYKSDEKNISKEILNVIREDPFFYGFCFTDSKILGEMNEKINALKNDISIGELNNRKAFSYAGDFYKLQLAIISVKYKFYLFGKKRLVRQTIKIDKDGKTFIEEKYR
jgi:hypothetical protein